MGGVGHKSRASTLIQRSDTGRNRRSPPSHWLGSLSLACHCAWPPHPLPVRNAHQDCPNMPSRDNPALKIWETLNPSPGSNGEVLRGPWDLQEQLQKRQQRTSASEDRPAGDKRSIGGETRRLTWPRQLCQAKPEGQDPLTERADAGQTSCLPARAQGRLGSPGGGSWSSAGRNSLFWWSWSD